jgi:hypothetical protein
MFAFEIKKMHLTGSSTFSKKIKKKERGSCQALWAKAVYKK